MRININFTDNEVETMLNGINLPTFVKAKEFFKQLLEQYFSNEKQKLLTMDRNQFNELLQQISQTIFQKNL